MLYELFNSLEESLCCKLSYLLKKGNKVKKFVEDSINALKKSDWFFWTQESLKKLPKINGVYVLYASDGTMLYIGSSKNIYDRVYNHHRRGGTDLTERLRKLDIRPDLYLPSCYLKYIAVEYGRAELEEFLIKHFDPKLNNFRRKYKKNPEVLCLTK